MALVSFEEAFDQLEGLCGLHHGLPNLVNGAHPGHGKLYQTACREVLTGNKRPPLTQVAICQRT